MEVNIEIPPKLIPVFAQPRGKLRYRGAYGGRGSGKSFTFAKMAALFGYVEPLRILCTRELQVSIKESFHAELKEAISSEPWLANAYDVGENYIRGKNGTEFIFKGLRHNIGAVKSTAKIDICIIEEAEDVPEKSWVDLIPTIRSPKSEIWVIWNPRVKGSPVDRRFIQQDQPRQCIVEMNYSDNPWFPDVLEETRIADQKVMDDSLYNYIWNGDYYEQSEAQIFKGKFREGVIDTKGSLPMYGLDWGFANDPTVAIECYIIDRTLYISKEAGRVGLELDETASFLGAKIPNIRTHVVRADCARPESISYCRRKGIPQIQAADKWQGSVKDGIEHIRSYDEVVIHPDCLEVLNEFRFYSYKVNKQSGDIVPEPHDSYNHYIDAIRYALAPLIKQNGFVFC